MKSFLGTHSYLICGNGPDCDELLVSTSLWPRGLLASVGGHTASLLATSVQNPFANTWICFQAMESLFIF